MEMVIMIVVVAGSSSSSSCSRPANRLFLEEVRVKRSMDLYKQLVLVHAVQACLLCVVVRCPFCA